MSQTIHLLIASTREGRAGPAIAKWVEDQIKEKFNVEVKTIDLYDEQLPFFNNATSPMRSPDDTLHGQAWAKKIKEVERLVIVMPEYNRGVPAALKNALDYLWEEWHNMPVALVSYGYIDGGARATAHLKDTLDWLKVNKMKNDLNIQLTTDMLGETGDLKDVDTALAGNAAKLKSLIQELLAAEPTKTVNK